MEANTLTVKAVSFTMCIQIFLATWLMSGTTPEFLLPMFFVSVGTFVLCIIGKLFTRGGVFLSAIVWASIFFIIVCFVQYLNPFAEYVVRETFSYITFLDYIDCLPASVRAEFYDGNSLYSLCALLTSFLTAFVLATISTKQKTMFSLLVFFSINAFVMGIFALWQEAQGIPMPFNRFHTNSGFYGTFFLSNAAGAYLNMGVAATLACSIVCFQRKGIFVKLVAYLFVVGAFVISWASFQSGSKGAMILCSGIWGIVCVYLFLKVIVKFFGSKVFYFTVCITGFVVCFVGIVGIYFSECQSVRNLSFGNQVNESICSRMAIYKEVFPIIKQRPIWGTGGECSRYILPVVKKPDGSSVAEAPERVHSDLFEYMVDFGITGVIVLLCCGIAWIVQIVKNRKILTSANVICVIGVLSCLTHSMFDMELHIPSTMIVFAFMSVFSFSDFEMGRTER